VTSEKPILEFYSLTKMVQYIGHFEFVLITFELVLTLGTCLQPAATTLARGVARETRFLNYRGPDGWTV
jgi:hypothetical protein